MARLFITPREQNLISDLSKEIIKDVVGQKIYYYPISESKTLAHGIYNESTQKIYDQPIEIEALVDSAKVETRTNKFGTEQTYKIEVYVQYRDMLDKGIQLCIGDFFSFGDVFYEISSMVNTRNIYGQVDQIDGITLSATKARDGQFRALPLGPTNIKYTDDGAAQNTFVQQRGYAVNELGETGDVRDLQRNGVLDEPLTGTRKVSPEGDTTGSGPSFYDED
jgi:hypothetical protein